MANTTNFGWETPDDTDLVKDGASAMRTLGNAIDTSLVDLKGGTTGQVLSKASNTDMDFTWVAQDDSNAIQNAIVDAKGDLISATAADTPARLAVGTNGQVLTADSTQSTGLAWTTISSGGMTLISRQTPSASTGFSFSSIPGTYKQLLLVWHGLYLSNTSTTFNLRFDNTAGNYQVFYIYGANGTVTNDYVGGTSIEGALALAINNNTASNDYVSSGRLEVYDYASTTKDKKYFYENRLRNTQTRIDYSNGVFGENGAITSIDFVRTTGTGTLSTLTDGYIDLFGVN